MNKFKIDFDKLKQSITIEDIVNHFNLEFKRIKPDQLQGNCPFQNHSGDRNSFSFGINTQKDIYICPTHCGKGAGIIDFYCGIMGLDKTRDAFKAALQLKEIFISKIDNTKALKQKPKTQEKYTITKPNDSIKFTLNVEYNIPYLLNDKKLTPETLKYFGIGKTDYGALKNHIAIPVHNESGQLIGYAGQNTETDKWKFFFNKSVELFNYHRIKQPDKLPYLIIVESFYSCIYLHQNGFKNVVAIMGDLPQKSRQS